MGGVVVVGGGVKLPVLFLEAAMEEKKPRLHVSPVCTKVCVCPAPCPSPASPPLCPVPRKAEEQSR